MFDPSIPSSIAMKKELVVLFLLSGCGGSFVKKKEMANSHFRQASLDIKDYHDTKNIGALRKALNEVDKAVAFNPAPQILGLKATILLQLGELEQSKAVFERIINDKKIAHAKRADARNNYATVLYQLGQTALAQRIWLEVAHDSHYVSPEVAYFNLGYSELNEARKLSYQMQNISAAPVLEHVQQATVYFKNALAISHEYIDALFFLGQAMVILDKLLEARDCYVRILTINPDHVNAQELLRQLEERLVQESPPSSSTSVVSMQR